MLYVLITWRNMEKRYGITRNNASRDQNSKFQKSKMAMTAILKMLLSIYFANHPISVKFGMQMRILIPRMVS